jgi:hypothetical protein
LPFGRASEFTKAANTGCRSPGKWLRASRYRAVSRCTPPFDSGFGHPCLGEVMREQLRLPFGNLRKLVFERFSNSGV